MSSFHPHTCSVQSVNLSLSLLDASSGSSSRGDFLKIKRLCRTKESHRISSQRRLTRASGTVLTNCQFPGLECSTPSDAVAALLVPPVVVLLGEQTRQILAQSRFSGANAVFRVHPIFSIAVVIRGVARREGEQRTNKILVDETISAAAIMVSPASQFPKSPPLSFFPLALRLFELRCSPLTAHNVSIQACCSGRCCRVAVVVVGCCSSVFCFTFAE